MIVIVLQSPRFKRMNSNLWLMHQRCHSAPNIFESPLFSCHSPTLKTKVNEDRANQNLNPHPVFPIKDRRN
jgi:hypothetical protein